MAWTVERATRARPGAASTHHFDLVNWLVGAAANRSLASGLPVRIVELAALEPEATRLSQLV